MEFKSNKAEVLLAMKMARKEFCQGVGTLAVAEVQSITPVGVGTVNPGNLKKSIVSDSKTGYTGVNIGVTPAAPYGINVEKGIGQPAQHFLENGTMNAVPKITNIAEAVYKATVGGK